MKTKSIAPIRIAIGLMAGLLPMIIPAKSYGASESVATATADVSNRMANKLGFTVGVFDPAPALLGVSVNYNLFDFMRLTAGYGKISVTSGMDAQQAADGSIEFTTREASLATYGAGARFMVPGWSLTPVAGLNFAAVSYDGDPGALSVGGFTESGSHLYMNLGLDWQTKSGFNLGAGMTQSFKSGIGRTAYLSLGWYFNWLGT